MIETSSGTIDLTEITSRPSQAQVIETSRLAAPPVAVWEQVASMTGVNAELMPAVRMTFPRACETLDRVRLDPQRPLVRSVLMLFGALPVDVHSLALATLDPGAAFSNRLPRFCTAAGSTSACSTPRAMGPESAIASISSADCLVSA
jgi:hypothetical protein